MSSEQRNKFGLKIYLIKGLLLIAIFVILIEYNSKDTNNLDYQLGNIAYLYDGNKVIGVNEGQFAENLVTTHKQIGDKKLEKNLTEKGEDETLNTKVISSPSILNYDLTENEQAANIDYVKENTAVLKQGYTITIDGEYKYYVPDQSIIKWVAEQIMLAYVPDKSYVEYYSATGDFKEFTEDGVTYTNLEIDNDITVTEGYQQGSVYVENGEDLLFELFHKNQTPSFEYISDDASINSIIDDNGLSTIEFKLNNPLVSSNNVTYNGQPVVVNNIDPILNVVQTAERTETEVVEYATVEEEDPNLLTGQFEVKTPGQDGEKEVTYKQQIVNGELVEEEEIGQTITKAPVHQVLSIGEGTQVNSVTVNNEGEVLSTNQSVTPSGMIWPSDSSAVTCEYGGYSGHTGIDIQNYYGAPEYAAADGVVVTSGWSIYGYGYYVVLDHGNGVRTLYAHQNQQPPVYVGQQVKQGQVIGFEGETGRVSGEHLHFEVLINGTAVNPRPYITNEPALNMGSVCS